MQRRTSFESAVWRAACLLPALAGCVGDLGGAGPAGPGHDGFHGDLGGEALVDDTPAASGTFAKGNFDSSLCADRDIAPGEMPGLVRLTHRQYDFIVSDVLGVDAQAQRDFVDDQSFYGFDNNAKNLSVPENQVSRYRATAERVAQAAASAPAQIAETVPCVQQSRDQACRDAFLQGTLERLLRRPLTADETSRYSSLFVAADGLYEEGDAFERGMRLVLEAVLQSPAFLYRAELRETPLDGRVVPLTSHELAARLALTLWESVPDTTLMALANDDALTDPVMMEAQARRMLDDPRAERSFDNFHRQWLRFDQLHFTKDVVTFPDYDEESFAEASLESMLAFTRHVGLASDGSVRDLYTAPIAFVDENLSPTFGDEVSGMSGMTQIDTDPDERVGVLMQGGFLAGRADALDSSPIHRGAFIQQRALCTVFGPVPSNLGSLPARSSEIVTTRDQVEAKTASDGCQSCHQDINPAGFAFEGFDTLGRPRQEDNGAPVDASGVIEIDGELVEFNDAVEFAHVLADSNTARRCYTTEWFRYAMGRGEQGDDLCLLDAIDQAGQSGERSIKELLVALTTSRGFRFRAQEDI